MAADYILHPDFETSSAPICDLELCQARLHLDARFPWLVLVPQVADVRELEDLTPKDRSRLMEEVVAAGAAVRAVAEMTGRPVEKLNVAALGNVTPQLHVHVIGRRRADETWPEPVWGRGSARAYEPEALAEALRRAKAALSGS